MVEITELDSTAPVHLLQRSGIADLIENVEISKLVLLVENNDVSRGDIDLLVSALKEWLDYKTDKWNWLKVGENSTADELLVLKLHLAALLLSHTNETTQYDLMSLMSIYANPNVPWSSPKVASETLKLDPDLFFPFLLRFIDDLKPKLLKLANTKVSLAGYARPKVKSGLRPTLGLNGGSAGEDLVRKTWKSSSEVTSLSCVYFILQMGTEWEEFNHHWPLVTSFILNVLDDSDPLFRAQGCHLLGVFIAKYPGLLTNSRLDKVFQESVEVCLTYLPQLTPPLTSLHILQSAYPVLYQLLGLQKALYVQYIDVLEKNILGLVSHVQNRENDRETVLVLVYLVQQLHYIICEHIGVKVLACFSRTNFVVNQLLINPYVIEAENGPELVDSALQVHGAVLDKFASLNESEGQKLLLLYKYDLLGAWTVLTRRVIKYNLGTAETKDLIRSNVVKLKEIALLCGGQHEFEQDLVAIWDKAPETKDYVH